jgi:hypothetical protein
MPVVGLAVRVADLVAQMVPSLLVRPEESMMLMVGVGSGFTVIVVDADAEQAMVALVIVTA